MLANMAPADQAKQVSVPEGIKQLAIRVCSSRAHVSSVSDPTNALDCAWAILLDLDPSRQALPDVQDRSQANADAITQACHELCQQHRTGDAAQLQQLVQDWLSETHYVTRVGAQHDPQSCTASRFAAAPLTEQHAVLSLLLALRGSCPASRGSLTALPALGSNLLKDLQQEAQAAAAASAGSSGAGWVAMSAHPEDLLHASTTCRTQGVCWSAGSMHEARPCQHTQPDPLSSWVSPAVGAMQILQQMPLDATAHASTHNQHQDTTDEVLVAAACGDSTAEGGMPALLDPSAGATAPLPLLQQVAPQMQLASSATLLGRPLLLHQSPQTQTSTSSSCRYSIGVGAAGPRGMSVAPSSSARPLGPDAHSAAAAEAEAAVAAAAAVQPRVKALMALSSAKPSQHNTLLGGSSACSGISNSSGRVSKDGETWRDSDTALMRDAQPLLRKDRRVGQGDGGTCTLDSGSSSGGQAEAELVSTACLALQGVWSAVEALWGRVLDMSQQGKAYRPDRKRGLCQPAVQQQLLVRVLHTAELRLRLKAFLQHFQLVTACSSSSGSRNAASSSSEDTAEAILTAFVNAVAAVLAEQDASLAAGQLRRLRQLQQQGRQVSLLQLLVVQREMTAQLQQLAELCWCTVQEYVDQKMFLKANSASACSTSTSLSALPASTQTSSSMNWHVLRHVHGGEQAWAAVAALQGAAAAAYEGALPWPGQGEAAAAAGLAWAPSSWQLRQGIEGGHALLERLCAGIRDAGPEATPLLRHLFAAAVQPVLHSLCSWAFLPDTQAAEAAAEATAMASFTAGGSSGSSSTQWSCVAAAASGAGGVVAVGGPFAAAAGGAGAVHWAGAHGSSGSSGGGCGGSSAKHWSGSRAAESSMRQCLQQAWSSVCDRLPGCPGFLAHVQEPARVAGLQLHLLQLLGAPGQELAERLGWLAELEQQELSEVLSVPLEGLTAAAGVQDPHSSHGLSAGVGTGGAGAMLQLPGIGGGLVGLLGGSSMTGGCGGGGISGGVGPHGDSLTCNMTPQQLKQCAAVAADFRVARQVEVQRLLQDMAQRRVAHQAAHELWLAGRQEERRVAEEARARLQTEAAMRRKQRRQRLLLQQQEDIAAAETRRLEARVRNLTFEQQLLHEAALKEHKQAVQQLRHELATLDSTIPSAATAAAGAAAAAAAELPILGDLICGQGLAAGAAAASADGGIAQTGRLVSGFASASGAAAAAAAAAADLAGGLDAGSILLDLAAADDAGDAGDDEDGGHPGDADGAASMCCTAGGESTSELLDLGASAVTEQQQQQRRQRGTWGPPVLNIGPAAGAPSGQHAAGPLAVIGSAAAAAAAGRDQQQQAAGRRSNSQPRVLPGMGRPVSASHSRRNSSSDDGSGGLFSSADGAAAAAAITAAAGGAAVGGAGSVGAGVASRAGRGGAVGGISSMSSILGGFGASAFGAGASAGRGNAARGKWGVPVVPGPAAGAAGGGSRGAAGGAPTLQRRASTGDILALGDVAMGTSSSSSGLREQQHLGGQQGWQGLQRQSSGGLAAAGRPRSGSFSGGGSRPSTPRGRRAADAAAAAAAPRPHQQGQLQRQQSWHHMQQQQMLLLQEQELSMGWADGTGCVSSSPAGFNALGGLVIGGAGAGSAAADGVDVTAAAAAAAASTGWLLSRSQQRGGRAVFQEGQGNSLIVAWLMQQNGFVGAVAGAAAGDSAVAAGGQAMLLPGGGDNGNHNNDGDGDANGRGSSLQHGNPAVAAAGARPAAPLVACFEVLLVQPLMEQCRLTTVACWSLLLHEHRLLQRLSTIQGLFFQQQGDWVVLLCDALEPLLLAQQQQGCGQQGSGQQGCSQQQQQQQQGEGGVGGGSGVSHGLASPVVLQLLLEGAVQQSCLAKMPEAECMSLQAVVHRALRGWTAPAQLPANSTSSGSSQRTTSPAAAAAAAAAGATDCLVLGYEAPWPVSLLLGQHQLQQYADVFSVLLRLRRLQQQLMKQWQPLNHRASSSSSTSNAGGRRARHASDAGAHDSRSGSSGVGSDSRAARRATWHGAPGQSSSCLGPAVRTNPAPADAAAAAGVDVGLSRLQDLRRWHALSLHCIDSLLGYMLGELSGQQQSKFEAAVGRDPVELHVMLQAHERLLAAAREVCFLPPAQQQHAGMWAGAQQQQQQGGPGGQQQQVRVAGAGKRIELAAYALVESAWQLQQHIAQLLASQAVAAAGADHLAVRSGFPYLPRSAAGGGSSSRHGFDRSGGGAGVDSDGRSGRRVLARAPSGFKEGSCCSGLAAALEGDAAGVWDAVEPAGLQLERLVEGLKKLLKQSMHKLDMAQVGHPLVGLAARLGV